MGIANLFYQKVFIILYRCMRHKFVLANEDEIGGNPRNSATSPGKKSW